MFAECYPRVGQPGTRIEYEQVDFRLFVDRTTVVAMRKVVAAALLCTALAGCSSGGSSQSAAPAPTSAAPAVTQDPNATAGLTVQADPSIVDARTIGFQSWTKVGPDRIAVHFESGSPVCYGVDATTTETTSTVTVLLKSGTKPDAVGKMCPMLAMIATLEIPLKSPLDDRTVVSVG
jgi:hypothetical protein